MIQYIGRIITIIASYTSLISLYFSLESLEIARQSWHIYAFVVGVLLAAVLIVWEAHSALRNRPKSFKSEEKINSYLCKWISSGGRVAIFSRDMSWAREGKVKEVLQRKAENNELIVCLENSIGLTADLKRRGADIVLYGEMGHRPRSRFTIVDFEKDGARVAVGVHENGKHVIQEFRSGEHPFFAVAEDLVKFLIASNPQ